MKVAIVLALAIVTACAADERRMNPVEPEPEPDAGMMAEMPDAPMMEQGTLTTYVIDLVLNKTTPFTTPRPASEWAGLPDPDGDTNNLTSYASLF